jgi:hypothetical protein
MTRATPIPAGHDATDGVTDVHRTSLRFLAAEAADIARDIEASATVVTEQFRRLAAAIAAGTTPETAAHIVDETVVAIQGHDHARQRLEGLARIAGVLADSRPGTDVGTGGDAALAAAIEGMIALGEMRTRFAARVGEMAAEADSSALSGQNDVELF